MNSAVLIQLQKISNAVSFYHILSASNNNATVNYKLSYCMHLSVFFFITSGFVEQYLSIYEH